MSLLEIQDVDVHYERSQALNGVSAKVSDGEVVAIIGPNGAGKTTLFNAVSGLKEYDGSIKFKNSELHDSNPKEIVEKGLIHSTEGRDLFSFLSVEKNLRMGAFARGSNKYDQNLEMVYDLFPILEERREQKAGTLSGGEQQMLALGRSLMSDPDLLLLDEPSLGLAPVILDDLSKALSKLQEEGLTVLLAEQNLTFAMEHADRLYLLETGSIEMEGDAKSFENNEYIQEAYIGVV